MRGGSGGVPVLQWRSRAEGPEGEQGRSIVSAKIVVLGRKLRNVSWTGTAKKREEVSQVVQVDPVDEDVRIPLLEAGHCLGIGHRKTKVSTCGSRFAAHGHLLPQHLLAVSVGDSYRIKPGLQIRDGVRAVRRGDDFGTGRVLGGAGGYSGSGNRPGLSVQYQALNFAAERGRGDQGRDQERGKNEDQLPRNRDLVFSPQQPAL